MQAAFVRTVPVADGKTCAFVRKPVVSAAGFSARCQMEGVEFTVHASARGDLARDFSVETVMVADTTPPRQFTPTLHFKRLGACPAGWRVGDSAVSGGAPQQGR